MIIVISDSFSLKMSNIQIILHIALLSKQPWDSYHKWKAANPDN